MIDTIDLTSSDAETGGSDLHPSLEQLAVQLMDRAKDEGVSLVGPGGLLAGLAGGEAVGDRDPIVLGEELR